MKCFYHSADLDGHCSGAIIKDKYPECEMFGVDYDDELNRSTITPRETVFIVDFSFSVDDMDFLADFADLVWIDHHKSAIEKMAHNSQIRGFREIGKAGCELTWEYLYPEDTCLPIAVQFLGRYDIWDHRDERVLPFQYGMRDQENTLPGVNIWTALFDSDNSATHIINHGEIILAYENKQNEKYAKSMSYETEFHGHRAIVMNKPFSSSKVFDSVYDPNKHDIMVLFGVKSGKFKYSIYCNKPEIDVSVIATQYGGGGHAGAAGFYFDKQII